MQEASQKKSPDFLSGGGEMGKRIRDFDWSKTSLGDPEHWEQSLKTCVRIMLASSQPIWIGWGPDLIKLYNDPYIAIVAGKHPQALGQPASVVWKDIWKDIAQMLSRAMEKDEGSYVESKLLIMHRSGYPEEVYYTFSYTPVLGENGKPAGIICYNTADTERIINERALQTMRQLDVLVHKKTEMEVYQLAMKAIGSNKKDFPFAILYKITGEGTSANPFAFAGIDDYENELLQKIDLHQPDFKSKDLAEAVFNSKLVEAHNEGRWSDLPKGDWDIMPQNFVYVPIRAANKKFPLAVLLTALNPYRKFDEAFKNFVQLIGDQISLHVNNAIAYEEERKRSEALEALDKAKTAFFSNISHEFRTPITLMLGPLEDLLQKSDSFTAAEMQSVETAHRNTMRLLRLVNALLDFSRIESGRQHASFSQIDIGAYTKDLAANFRSVIEKAGLAFLVETERIGSPVYLDRQMWEKIVFNLLSNAFKYTLAGSISVKVYQQDENAVLQIADTGIGIPEEELPLMFDRFHRVQHSSGRTYEGTGIGLSLIKEFVKLHGGEINVTSKLGKGSIFTVTIPSGKDHLPESRIAENSDIYEEVMSSVFIEEARTLLEADKSNSTTGDEPKSEDATDLPKVLIVDDNSDMRHHLEHVLSSKFKIVTAIHGADALEKIKADQPDLVLSDIMMPVMDGIELLKKIKGGQHATLPVILLTARAGEESRIAGYETGADDYLVKPFTATELVARINSQIHLARARKEVSERLRELLMQAPAAIAILEGPEHIITLANSLFLDMYSRTEGEMIGKMVREVYPEVEGQGIYELFHHVYVTGESFSANEFRATFYADGKPKTGFYDFVIHPIKNNNGDVTDLMLHAIDVTASVLARKAVESNKTRLNNIITQVQAGIAQSDLDGILIDVNDRFCEMVGRTKEALIGTQIDDITHPHDQPRSRQLFKVCVETGKSFTIEKRYLKPDGGVVWVNNSVSVISNELGKKFITSLSIDITEQFLFRAKIEESERRFRTLAETLPQLVWMTDENGEQQFASRRWFEYSGVVPVGEESWRKIVHADDIDELLKTWQHSLETGDLYQTEIRIKSRKGEYRWHVGQGEPVRNEDGKIVNWIGAFADIHDRRSFSEKLESEVANRTSELARTNKELESFNYIASHDLQEPLRKIQTFIYLMQKDGRNEELEKKYFAKITTSAQRMSQLIQNVLDYSRLSQNNEGFEATDLNKILDTVKSDYELIIAEKDAIIESDPLPTIEAIPLLMHQLFANLISNSLKFSQEKPVIKIKSKIVKGYHTPIRNKTNVAEKFAEISLSDNGIGFEPQYSEQIFKLFQRLHSKSEYSGTGVGLSIVSKILERHGGYIRAESENQQGATFTLWLPVQREQ